MKILILDFRKPITSRNIRVSFNYHIKKLRNLYAKGNKACYLGIYAKILSNKLEVVNSVDKVIINILDRGEIEAYYALLYQKCFTNHSAKESKPRKIELFYHESDEKTYKDFLTNSFAK